jgi:hypothetical protein
MMPSDAESLPEGEYKILVRERSCVCKLLSLRAFPIQGVKKREMHKKEK